MASRRSRNFLITAILLVIIAFTATLGGNLVDMLTGGSGTNSWYGKRGVIARLTANQTQPNDRDGNGLNDQSQKTSQSEKTQSGGTSATTLKYQEETRYAPELANTGIKALPAGAVGTTTFSILNGQFYCTIGATVECFVVNYAGNVGQIPGNTVKFVLSSSGTSKPSDAGLLTANTTYPLLNPGVTAASGDFACTIQANGVDCWSLSTGKGMVVTTNNSHSYQPRQRSRRGSNPASSTTPSSPANPNQPTTPQ